jgi:UDP-glucose 6-dehydrogenase
MRMVVDLAKVEGLQNGEIPIYERALEELVTNNVAACKLQ